MIRRTSPLSDSERLDWLRLSRTEGVGPVAFRELLRRFGTAGKALEALPQLAKRAGRLKPMKPVSRAEAADELETWAKAGARLLAQCEPDYPETLAAAEDAPPLIGVRGRLDLLAMPKVGIVGARNASANGRRIAEDMAAGLAENGFTVVSGMARGIDTAAHLGALKTGQHRAGPKPGGTVAVVAGGIDVLYPPENAALFDRLALEGAIVAELPPGTTPQARHFPRRNRIISGLSLGVVVVEAALKSGSLITARLALDQGRDVMAVPGSPLDPRCRGTNRLIREGAILVEDYSHILEHLGQTAAPKQHFAEKIQIDSQDIDFTTSTDMDSARSEVVSLLGPSPVAVDELLRQCHCSAPIMGMVLLELDLAGRLERHPGNRVSLLMQAA
jgi:DNA processing protein